MTTPSNDGRTGRSVDVFERAIIDNLYFTRGQSVYGASENDLYMSLAYTVRDHLMARWRRTVEAFVEADPKVVYYLSAEYLLGKQLPQNMLYTGTTKLAKEALGKHNRDLDDYIKQDVEPGLGNGGLGRLAACFLDSLATMNIPCIGYGIRYEYGIFRQSFEDGWQVESPDKWLKYGNPWEFAQPDDIVEVYFGGRSEQYYWRRWLVSNALASRTDGSWRTLSHHGSGLWHSSGQYASLVARPSQ